MKQRSVFKPHPSQTMLNGGPGVEIGRQVAEVVIVLKTIANPALHFAVARYKGPWSYVAFNDKYHAWVHNDCLTPIKNFISYFPLNRVDE